MFNAKNQRKEYRKKVMLARGEAVLVNGQLVTAVEQKIRRARQLALIKKGTPGGCQSAGGETSPGALGTRASCCRCSGRRRPQEAAGEKGAGA